MFCVHFKGMVSVNTLIVIVCFAQSVRHEWYSTTFFFLFFFFFGQGVWQKVELGPFGCRKTCQSSRRFRSFSNLTPAPESNPSKSEYRSRVQGQLSGADSHFQYPLHPSVLLLQRKKIPVIRPKSAGGRFQLNARAPYVSGFE